MQAVLSVVIDILEPNPLRRTGTCIVIVVCRLRVWDTAAEHSIVFRGALFLQRHVEVEFGLTLEGRKTRFQGPFLIVSSLFS